MFEFLDDHQPGTFAQDEAVAVSVERTAGSLGSIVSLGESAHGRKRTKAQWGQCGLGASGDDDVGLVVTDS